MNRTPLPEGTSQPVSQWMTAARDGSREALGHLLDWYQPYLLNVAEAEWGRDLRAKRDPPDLVQDTFMAALKEFRHFQGTAEPQLRAWLRRILASTLANARRALQTDKRQAAKEVPLAEVPLDQLANGLVAPDETPSSLARQDETRQALRRAVDQLAEEHRTVIHLYFYERFPWDEVARRMDRNVEAVRELQRRAVRQLTKRLKRTGLLEALF